FLSQSKPSSTSLSSLSFYCYRHHRHLHSFPTRRSSDLKAAPYACSCQTSIGPRAYLSIRRVSSSVGFVMSSCTNSLPSAVRIRGDRKSTRLNSSHLVISYAVFCLKKKKNELTLTKTVEREDAHQHGQRRATGARKECIERGQVVHGLRLYPARPSLELPVEQLDHS